MHLVGFITTILLFVQLACADLATYAHKIVPDQCEAQCQPFLDDTMGCIDKTGTMSITYDMTNGIQFQGNKLDLYLCVCSDQAKGHSAECLQCVSNVYCLQPPVDSNTYNEMCLGNISIENLMNTIESKC